eukprot:m.61369 g.61369  ORF g.61369 m.61369 type:complete len:419 (-) comp17549_c0_seq1:312-1568(-)
MMSHKTRHESVELIVPVELGGGDKPQTRSLVLTADTEDARRVAALIDAAITVDAGGIIATRAPWLKTILENPKVHEALGWIWVIFTNYIFPFSLKMWKVVEGMRATTEIHLLSGIYGLALAFFGGYFAVTIAAIEAWKMSGWETTSKALGDLHANYCLALVAHNKDNKIDADHDGIADVDQISKQELVQRKLLVFAKAIDPEICSSAFSGLWTAWLSVLTTLKFRYAKTVALGASLGQMMREPAMDIAVPILVQVLPQQYYKWINTIVGYSIKSIGITIAWTIQSIQSAFQSAIKGGLIFSESILQYATLKGYIPPETDLKKMKAKEILAGTVAFLGFYWQISNGLQLPFPVNVGDCFLCMSSIYSSGHRSRTPKHGPLSSSPLFPCTLSLFCKLAQGMAIVRWGETHPSHRLGLCRF